MTESNKDYWNKPPDSDTFLRALVQQSPRKKKSGSGRYLADVFTVSTERFIQVSETIEAYFRDVIDAERAEIFHLLAGFDEPATLKLYNVPYLDPTIYEGEKMLIPQGDIFTQFPEYLEEVETQPLQIDVVVKYIKEFFIVTGLLLSEENIVKVLQMLLSNVANTSDDSSTAFEQYVNNPESQIKDPLLLRTMLICFAEDYARRGETAEVIYPREKIPYLGSAERRRIVSDVLQKDAAYRAFLEDMEDSEEQKITVVGPNNEDEVKTSLFHYFSSYVSAWPIISRLNIHPIKKISQEDRSHSHVLPYKYPFTIATLAVQSVMKNEDSQNPEDAINTSMDPVVLAARKILVGKKTL